MGGNRKGDALVINGRGSGSSSYLKEAAKQTVSFFDLDPKNRESMRVLDLNAAAADRFTYPFLSELQNLAYGDDESRSDGGGFERSDFWLVKDSVSDSDRVRVGGQTLHVGIPSLLRLENGATLRAAVLEEYTFSAARDNNASYNAFYDESAFRYGLIIAAFRFSQTSSNAREPLIEKIIPHLKPGGLLI
jgi:hypothetical protein